ncbi:hypothetical protein PDM81_25420, partial [Bacillus cereus group sp. Bcc03]|nr:hypothetical protein [Bacillus cereus group sp. Bcc03]
LNSSTCNIVALSFTYSALLAFLLRFAFLNSLLATSLLFLLPILLYLHSFCALLSLTLQLATSLLFLLPILLYLHSFCALFALLSLTYIPLRFVYLNSSTCNTVALSLTYLSSLTFLLRLVCPSFPYLHSFTLCLP